MDASRKKRRIIAKTSVQVELYVRHEEADRVGDEQFDEWNHNVMKILDDAEKVMKIETDKFLKTQEGLGMQAPMEPLNWRQRN